MSQRFLAFAILACIAAPAFGQQVPGIHDTNRQVPVSQDEPVRRSPSDCQEELARLQLLVEAQNQKIALLEAKIAVLQQAPAPLEGDEP